MEKVRVLVVDDDPALRTMLAFSLGSSGYQVFEAASKDEALVLLQNEIVPVVLLDMGMPPNEHSLDEGVAVLEWLGIYQPNVNVIVLTGQYADKASYIALKHGAFDFLAKPITFKVVLNSVERAILFYKQALKLRQEEGVQRVQLDAVLGEGVKSIRNKAEEKLIRQVLTDTGFNVHETARRLDLKRENIYYLIKKYGLVRATAV